MRLLGVDVSYGTGVQGELRFEDHFWLLHLTPVEVSAVVYRKRSLDIELFVGVRGTLTGAPHRLVFAGIRTFSERKRAAPCSTARPATIAGMHSYASSSRGG